VISESPDFMHIDEVEEKFETQIKELHDSNAALEAQLRNLSDAFAEELVKRHDRIVK